MLTIGTSRAFSSVVERRSYSRISGLISDESEIATPGRAAASISPTLRSCAGLA